MYGTYEADCGRGVMVFEDFTEVGPYVLNDPHLMLLDPKHVRDVVRNLSTFHGICVAFRATEPQSLETIFPLLDDEGGGAAFFQDDMKGYLHEMYSTCKNFLQVSNIILCFKAKLC